MRPVCIIVRDGWGYNENPEGNAVAAAHTPNIDAYKDQYPWTLLDASGEPVGLPDGYQGSSEVGHLNMGAGRIVIQELKRIDDGLRTGALFEVDDVGGAVAQLEDDTQAGCTCSACCRTRACTRTRSTSSRSCAGRARSTRRARSSSTRSWTAATRRRAARLEYLAKLDRSWPRWAAAAIGTVMGRYYAHGPLAELGADGHGLSTASCAPRGGAPRPPRRPCANPTPRTRRRTAWRCSTSTFRRTCIGDYDGVRDGDACPAHQLPPGPRDPAHAWPSSTRATRASSRAGRESSTSG